MGGGTMYNPAMGQMSSQQQMQYQQQMQQQQMAYGRPVPAMPQQVAAWQQQPHMQQPQ